LTTTGTVFMLIALNFWTPSTPLHFLLQAVFLQKKLFLFLEHELPR
jgi:hypothetical protein